MTETYKLKVSSKDPDIHNPSHEEINKNLSAIPLEVEKGERAWFAYKHPDGTWHRVQTSPVVRISEGSGDNIEKFVILETENSIYSFMRPSV